MSARRHALAALALLVATTAVAFFVGVHVHQYGGWLKLLGLVVFPATLLASAFPNPNDVEWVALMAVVLGVQYAYCWLVCYVILRPAKRIKTHGV